MNHRRLKQDFNGPDCFAPSPHSEVPRAQPSDEIPKGRQRQPAAGHLEPPRLRQEVRQLRRQAAPAGEPLLHRRGGARNSFFEQIAFRAEKETFSYLR